MIEIHRYNLITHREIIEAYFEDNKWGVEWVNHLNHIDNTFPDNPCFRQYYWWGVPVYEIKQEEGL